MSRDSILYSAKIKSLLDLQQIVTDLKKEGKQIVFTNGCFDILHRGHIDYLYKSAMKGDVLIVGLNTDDSVKRQGKSTSRPIQDQDSRAHILAALACVDYVVLFNEDTPIQLISLLLPDVLVKGSDYKIEDIVGYDIVISNGGIVETIEFLPGYSTSLIEKKIKNS